jgi:hypothetical protein
MVVNGGPLFEIGPRCEGMIDGRSRGKGDNKCMKYETRSENWISRGNGVSVWVGKLRWAGAITCGGAVCKFIG